MPFEALIVLLLIVANGLLSMSELAVVSARKARLQQRAEDGDAGARAALELAEAPDRFLSTVQIGITLIGIVAGAFGGASVASALAVQLNRIPPLAPYSEPLAAAIVVAAITYLSLVIGELTPKRLALRNPEGIAATVARPMRLLSSIAGPVVALLSGSSALVMKLLRIGPSTGPAVTEEEVQLLIEQGTEAGVFEQEERAIVERVLRLDDLRVGELMTPRVRLVWLDVEDPPEENWAKIESTRHIYFPVCEGGIDNVIGILSVKDLWSHASAGGEIDLRSLLIEPLYVPESMIALRVLEAFKQAGTDMALVIDEYSSIQGVITLHDVLEAIVGDIPTPDSGDPQVQRREDGSWLLDGLLPIERLKTLLDVEQLPGEEYGAYQTLGGFVMQQIGRVPAPADHFEWGGMRFEVVDMDGNRVDKVLVAPQQPVIEAGSVPSR